MENRFIVFGLVFTLSFISLNVCFSQNGCPDMDNPYYAGHCEVGINRFLSRAVSAIGLSQYNNSENCWITGGNLPPSDNCTPPYNLCWGKCPSKYLEVINAAVDLKATMLVRAASMYGKEWSFHPDYLNDLSSSYNQIYKLVNDVNEAFDCAELPRPIIQGEIIEGFGATGQSSFYIPDFVIDNFMSEMTPSEILYYSIPQHFIVSNMFSNQLGPYWHSFEKIESRMWFYFAARNFIDLGCTSIHMGIYPFYANPVYDPGYEKLSSVCQKIRDYAASKNTFVLLTGETGDEPSAKKGNTDSFIFDFDSRAMRPHEIGIENSGDFDCDQVIPIESTIFTESPCDNEDFPAIIDPCIISQFGQSVGGTSPMGCHYTKMPYYIHWDFGSGILGQQGTDGCFNVDPTVGTMNQEMIDGFVYGYEDTRWFGQLLSDECKAAWIKSMYCNFRNEFGSDGFLQIPLLLPYKFTELYNYPACPPFSQPEADGSYFMSDDQTLMDEIQDFLEPTEPSMLMDLKCNNDYASCQYSCEGNNAPRWYIYWTGLSEYEFSVESPDCSSTYSWHIKDHATGNWFPIVLGNKRTFLPPHDGTYTITLRQDNLGFEPYSQYFGTKGVDFTFYANVVCCLDLIPIRDAYLCNRGAIESNQQDEFQYFSPLDLENDQIKQSGKILISNLWGQILYNDKFVEAMNLEQTIFEDNDFMPGLYVITYIYDSGIISSYRKLIIN